LCSALVLGRKLGLPSQRKHLYWDKWDLEDEIGKLDEGSKDIMRLGTAVLLSNHIGDKNRRKSVGDILGGIEEAIKVRKSSTTNIVGGKKRGNKVTPASEKINPKNNSSKSLKYKVGGDESLSLVESKSEDRGGIFSPKQQKRGEVKKVGQKSNTFKM